MLSNNELARLEEQAFSNRGSLLDFWQDTAELFYPERADFTTELTLGEDFAAQVYSSDPILFRRDFADWLGSVLRPKGVSWYEYKARQKQVRERQTVKAYLADKTTETYDLLYDHDSQFIRAMKQGDHDYATFGNCVSSVQERTDRNGLLFRTWHLRDCAWEENDDAVVDRMWRRYQTTLRNLAAKAKEGWTIPRQVLEKVDKEPSAKVQCCHVVMDADDFDFPARKRRGMQWVSVYYCRDHKTILSVKPIPVFNYAVSRWFTVAGSPYGFSPVVCTSIGDARSIQSMTWSILEAGERAVEPPLVAMRQAIMGGVNLFPGGVTWVDAKYDEREGEALRALQLGKEPQVGVVLRDALRHTMGDCWYLNKLFLPQPQSQPMTAEEIAARNAEMVRVAQPIIEPAETERNGKILEIATEMAQRFGYWGDLDDMPRELRGRDVDITYSNPIEDARRKMKTDNFRRTLNLSTEADAIDPALKGNVDWQKGFRDALEGITDPSWIKPETEGNRAVVDGQKQQQANAMGQQAAQLVQAADVAAGAAEKTAKADKAAAEAQAVPKIGLAA